MTGHGDLTRLLTAASAGDRRALDAALPAVYDELKRLFHGRSPLEWFSIGCLEPGPPTDPDPALESTQPHTHGHVDLTRPPFSLVSQEFRAVQWDPSETGDLPQRMNMQRALAARAELTIEGSDARARAYLLVVHDRDLRWTVCLCCPIEKAGWEGLAADDATAAVTFTRLELGG